MDGYEPHDHIILPYTECGDGVASSGMAGVYPGYGSWVGAGRGYTGYPASMLQDPDIDHI